MSTSNYSIVFEMEHIMIIMCVLSSSLILSTVSQETSDMNKLLNWCIDAKHHKSEPGPEGSLYGQCSPWKAKSCCTSNTTENIHLDPTSLYNFRFSHCLEKKPLSAECHKHFTQDHCFYECSPNIGPWVVKEPRSWRKERYFRVPLCASDCNAWFVDCKDDYTCTDNWSKNFEWVTMKDCSPGKTCKQNICPSGSRCQTFFEIYRTAEAFCEKVWDESWEYTPDDEPCMRLWFNGSAGNPNLKVAQWKASQISGAHTTKGNVLFVIMCSSFLHLLLFKWWGRYA